MVPLKNLPLLMNLSWYAYNRGLSGDFRPLPDGTTFCNLAMQYVLNGFGYDKMNGLNANTMVSFMQAVENGWITIGDDVAQVHANAGVLVLAGWANPAGHGHVCLIAPGLLEKSGAAGKPVPKCLNVGKDVFIGKRLSYAFNYAEEPPTLFALAGMI